MKSLLILIFFFCLAIAVEAQLLKLSTAKRQVTSTKPKQTTIKSTIKATTLKTTTRKTNGAASATTGKPVTPTPASTMKSYQVCRDTNSTATSGSIQPLDGLTSAATGSPRTCSFSIVAPSNQHVQMSCSVAKLTAISTVLNNTGGLYIHSSSLIFDGTLDLYYLNVIVPNRIYTSYSNRMTVTYRVVNATDTFNCNWTTIPTPTTDFKWCRDSETTAASGSIQTLREPVGNGNTYVDVIRVCPFFINSSPNRQVQTSCPFNASPKFGLSTFRKITEMFQPKFNKTRANSNQVDLLLLHRVTDTDSPIDCSWTTTTPTTATSDFNNCVHVQSTTTNGTISSLVNTANSKTCLFSVFVSLGQRIQMSCTNIKLNDSSTLTLSEIAELSTRPSLNKVYTSISNRLDVFSTLVDKSDSFQCNWTTITIPPTTDFKLCRDGEATVAPGTITPLSNTTVNGVYMCRFTVIAPVNKRVQMSCPFIPTFTMISLYEFNTFISFIANPPIVNKVYTSSGNEMNLLWMPGYSGSSFFNCTWTFV